MKGQFNYFLPEFFYSVKLPNHKELKEELYDKLLEQESNNFWTLSDVNTTFKMNNETLLNCKNLTDTIWKVYDQLLEEDMIRNSHSYSYPTSSNINSIWFNHYEKNMHQEVHNHLGSVLLHYSLVYLIHDKSDTGLAFSSSNSVILNYSDSRCINTKDSNVNIGEGHMVIFPSYMDHFVTTTTGERSTISANIVSSIN